MILKPRQRMRDVHGRNKEELAVRYADENVPRSSRKAYNTLPGHHESPTGSQRVRGDCLLPAVIKNPFSLAVPYDGKWIAL